MAGQAVYVMKNQDFANKVKDLAQLLKNRHIEVFREK